MKKSITSLLLLAGLYATAQVKVGDNPNTINASAVLEMESTNKGLLPPRMTTLQRDAISNPAKGLAIFNTTSNSLEVNTGTPASPVWSSAKSGDVNNTTLTSSTSPAGTSVGQMMYNTGAVQPTGLVYWDGSQWKSVASSGGDTTNNYPVTNNSAVTNNSTVTNNNPVTNNSTSTFNGVSTFNDQAVFNNTAVFNGGMKVGNLPQGAVTDSLMVFEPNTKEVRRLSIAGAAAAGEPWYKVGTTAGATANTDDVYLNGKVGVGTSAPDAKLHISGDASSNFKNSTIYSTNTGADGHTWSLGARPRGTAGDFAISDETNGVTRMTIQGGTGNVGIGTISPAQKLDVTGNLALRNSSVAGGNKHISIQNSAGLDRWAMGMAVAETGSGNAGGNFYLWNYDDNGTFLGNPLIINRASGNVAIGTGSTNARLNVGGATASTATNIDPLINVSATDGTIGGLYHSHNGTSSYIGLTSQNAAGDLQTPIALNQWGGNVGIGTATPAANLHVSSPTGTTVNIANTGDGQASLDFINNGVKRWRLINEQTANGFLLYDQDNEAVRMYVDGTNGNVGIGTSSPAYKLDVKDDVDGLARFGFQNISAGTNNRSDLKIGSGQSGAALYAGVDNGSSIFGAGSKAYIDNWSGGRLVFGTNAQEHMALYPTGRVTMVSADHGARLNIGGSIPSSGTTYDPLVTFAATDGAIGTLYHSNNGSKSYIGLQSFVAGDGEKTPIVFGEWGGNVGIGINTPKAPLHIGGTTTSESFTTGAHTWIAFSSGSVGTSASSSSRTNASFIAEGAIWSKSAIFSAQTMTFSDKRIKNIIGQSDATKDLDLLNKIRITDYRMKDVVMQGNKQDKKVIAQEVEAIYPEAVTQQTGFVPNIYQLADKVVSLGNNTYKVSFTNKVEYNTNVTGDLKLYDEQKEITAKVVSKGDNEIVFTTAEEMKGDKLFLFGEEVTDFRAVDYEALSTLNISATQELYREIQALKKQNAVLTAQVGDTKKLETAYNELAAQVKAMQEVLNMPKVQDGTVAERR